MRCALQHGHEHMRCELQHGLGTMRCELQYGHQHMRCESWQILHAAAAAPGASGRQTTNNQSLCSL